MLFGASASALGLAVTGSPMLALLAGMAGGLLAAAVLAFATDFARANQIVMGIGFNLLAIGATSLIRQLWLSGAPASGSMRSVAGILKLPWLSDIPVVGVALFWRKPMLLSLAVLVGIALWVLFRFTRAGLLLRAVGENALSTDAAGHPVLRLRFFCRVVHRPDGGTGWRLFCWCVGLGRDLRRRYDRR